MSKFLYKLKRLIKSPRALFIWSKALDAVASNDYRKSRELLDKNSDFCSGKDVEHHLLSGLVYYRTDEFSKSLSDIVISMELLEKSKHYSEEEKNYLYCYADRLINKMVDSLPEGASQPEYRGDFTKINKSDIREGIRLNFPLTIIEPMGSDLAS